MGMERARYGKGLDVSSPIKELKKVVLSFCASTSSSVKLGVRIHDGRYMRSVDPWFQLK